MNLEENASQFVRNYAPRASEIHKGYHYLLVQFQNIPSQALQREMAGMGILLLDYIPNAAYIAAIPQGFDLENLVQRGARSFLELDRRFKLAPELYRGEVPEWAQHGNEIEVVVKFYDNVARADVESWIRSRYWINDDRPHPSMVTLRSHPARLQNLLLAPFVQYIAPVEAPPVKDDIEGRSLHRSNAVNSEYPAGRHYDGTGVTIGLADDGFIGPHIDYSGRLTQFSLANSGNHGDMTAGILFGAGNRDPQIRGHATGADLYYWDIGGYVHIADAVSHYNIYGVTLTSTSYSQGTGGVYDNTTEFIDEQIYDNPQLIHVFSAGNAGTANHGYGAGAGWANITGGRKAGKSVVTCGNLDDNDNLENSSSRGPTEDGRIKPDICANGAGQLSTDGNNGNQVGGGTSAAAPSVSGCITQLYDAYMELNGGQEPESPLIKACVLNTAEDLGNPGPDFQHGWGRINTLRALYTLEQNNYLKDSVIQGQTKTHSITVPANTAEVRAMVYWLDPEGSPVAAKALVNDLNMTMTDPSNGTWNPWVLDFSPSPAALNAPAVRGTDVVNNMEQVTLDNPAAGLYTVSVTGSAVPMGAQSYYLVWEFRTTGVELTYPIGGEGLEPGDTQKIRWDAHGTSGSFTLEYSTDGGSTWTTISSGVGQALRSFNWSVPNTLTGQARIRVSNGGNSDMSDADFSIISVPSNLTVDYACPDSIGISWSPVSGATGYEVYRLGNKYMDPVGTTTSTSFAVYGLNPYNPQWLSVRALGPNNAAGRRAVAIEHSGGTLACTVPIDIGVDGLSSPGAGVLPACQSSSAAPVTIQLRNNGVSAASNVPVRYQINGGPVVSETFPGPLTASATTNYTFSQTANLGSVGQYEIVAWAEFSTDGNVWNDSASSSVSVLNTPVVSLPVSENFESFSLCDETIDCEATVCPLGNGWTNAANLEADDVDWRVDNDGTPSADTGPTIDHNPGTSTGKYVYLESSGGCDGKVAMLISPCIDLSNTVAPQMSFWYHMYGSNMGELHVDVLHQGTWVLDALLPIVGDQGNQWQQASLNLAPYAGDIVNIRLRGITGNGFRSDLALDDINISEVSAGPIVQFTGSPLETCQGSTVTLFDQSSNSPTSWNWSISPATYTFVGGTNANSQNPEVQFNAPGFYTVSLVATNPFGSGSSTQTNLIEITTGAQTPFSEDFAGAFTPSGWSIVDAGGNITWDQASVAGPNGSQTNVAWVDNFAYNAAGNEDQLVTLPIDLTGASSALLTFDVAYVPYSATLFDGLRIDVSTDCGENFSPSVYSKFGTVLATGPASLSSWTPSAASDWRNDSLDLAPYAGNRIVLSFVNINGYGNSLFIDNVNITTSSVSIDNSFRQYRLQVYPNPGDGRFTFQIDELPIGRADLEVRDLTGRAVYQRTLEGTGQAYSSQLDLRHVAAGVYYLQVRTSNGQQVKKLVIE